MSTRRFSLHTLLALAILGFSCCMPAHAQQRMTFIRDAETEDTIKTLAQPIFNAAGVDANAIRLMIVKDDELNAFVAGGSNIFLHTGLLMHSTKPEMLMGVLAHELGHITGGHLAKGAEQYENVSIQAAATLILAAAAAAAGSGEAGMAVASIGTQLAQRGFLTFTRSQEQQADQAAITYLINAGISPEGLLDLLETLRRRETMNFGAQTAYTRTHPLSKDRISHIRNAIENEGNFTPLSAGYTERIKRVVAKLRGFLNEPQSVLQYYANQTGDDARYGRAIAHYRLSELAKGNAELAPLLKRFPNDPYYNEVQGQFLFENGKVAEAIAAYEAANRLKPDTPIIQFNLASVLLASSKTEAWQRAVTLLNQSLTKEPYNSRAWDQLAIAHGKRGEKGLAILAQAEASLVRGKLREARTFAEAARQALPANATGQRRADEITTEAKRLQAKRKEDK